jgi:hypothetical protein
MSRIDPEQARLSEGLTSLLEVKGDGSACPAASKIWDSAAERLGREDSEAVLLHLGECSACSTAWRLAHRLHADERAGDVKAEEGDHRPRRWIPLAAAAVIVLGLGLGTLQLFTRQEAPPSYRIQEERWLGSALPPDRPLSRDDFVLRWTAGPEATTYELQATTEDLDPLVEVRGLERPEYRIDSSVLEDVPPGDAVLWRVTAQLPDGSHVSSATFATRLE